MHALSLLFFEVLIVDRNKPIHYPDYLLGFLLMNSLWCLLIFFASMAVLQMLQATKTVAVGMVVGCSSCSF